MLNSMVKALLVPVVLFLAHVVSSQRAPGCPRGWVSKKPLNLKTRVSCPKLEKVKISGSEDGYEVCAASCLEDNNCIGLELETANNWTSCNKVLNQDIWGCMQGNSLIYPKVCGTCTVDNIASLDINAVPGDCTISSSDKSLTLVAGTSCTLGCCINDIPNLFYTRIKNMFLDS